MTFLAVVVQQRIWNVLLNHIGCIVFGFLQALFRRGAAHYACVNEQRAVFCYLELCICLRKNARPKNHRRGTGAPVSVCLLQKPWPRRSICWRCRRDFPNPLPSRQRASHCSHRRLVMELSSAQRNLPSRIGLYSEVHLEGSTV